MRRWFRTVLLGFRRDLAALIFLSVLGPAAMGAGDPAAAETPAAPAVSFDLPRQPLAKALYAFSAATGIELLADARLVGGRQSSAVHGAMAPMEALQILLRGTGLVVQDLAPGTVTLTMMGGPPPGLTEVTHFRAPQPDYFAAIQRAVLRALCGADATVPGEYRLAMKFWIAPSGRIERTVFLDTTGQSDLDAALVAAMARLDIGLAPPPDLQQPVIVTISPTPSRGVPDCAINMGYRSRDAR